MARSMWRGAIQFGLVTIPVRLYLATESRGGLSFNLLHKEAKEGDKVVPCLRRIQMKTHCPEHGEISRAGHGPGLRVEQGPVRGHRRGGLRGGPAAHRPRHRDRPVRGDARPRRSAPIFVKQAYYLEPEPVGRKAFGLLKPVLAGRGLQGVCKIVLKDREQLSVLDPYQSTMLLSTIYWPDEVRDAGRAGPARRGGGAQARRDRHGQAAGGRDDGRVRAERYHDEYREALLKVIEAKVDGQQVEAPEPVVEARGLTDLMAVLEASVAAARDSRKAAPETASASKDAEEPIPVTRAKSKAKPKAAAADTDKSAEGQATATPQRRRKSA